jgi:hypothetical protein
MWHDWWNASARDTLVRVEVTPGERFIHMIETPFELARLGHTNAKGMPDPLQLAVLAREFSDVIEFRMPPPTLQRAIFGAPAPIAHRRGYRGTYPQLSRVVLAPRPASGWLLFTLLFTPCPSVRVQEVGVAEPVIDQVELSCPRPPRRGCARATGVRTTPASCGPVDPASIPRSNSCSPSGRGSLGPG